MKPRRRSKPTQSAPAACARPAGSSYRWTIAAAAALIALAAVAAYGNSFAGPFVFDGVNNVENNLAFHTLWPPWAPMIDTQRPIVAWTFAVNYAPGGTNPWGYHAVNLA